MMNLMIRFISIYFFSSFVNTQPNDKPNIVILIADDLGFGDLAPFGNKTIPTPNFDRLAKTGTKLIHHLAAESTCTPSRSALLTGRYPIRSGLASSWFVRNFAFVASSGGLPEDEITFAKLVKMYNYSTALIGKWHLGNYCTSKSDQCHNPIRHGFDYFYGTTLTNLKDFDFNGSSVVISFFPLFKHIVFFSIFTLATILIGSTLFDFSIMGKRASKIVRRTAIIVSIIGIFLISSLLIFQKSITRFNSILMRNEDIIEQPIIMNTLTDRIINESKYFIKKQHENDQKFLLMISFLKVHTALFPNNDFKGKSKHGKYGDSILELDYAIGQIIDHLENLNIRNQTFIYFSSDNGAHLEEYNIKGEYEGGYNSEYKGGKFASAMDGGIRVPAIVSWPNGKVRQNGKLSTPTSQMDLFATIAELVNHNSSIIDGESFLNLLKKNEYQLNQTDRLFIHYCGQQIHAARLFEDLNNIYKIYYFKPKFVNERDHKCEYMCGCTDNHVVKLDPPEIYNLADHPFESYLLTRKNSADLYNRLINKFNEEINKHKETIDTKINNQFSFFNIIYKPWLQPCCGSFPSCTCVEKQN